MIRLTTPRHTFKMPDDPTTYKKILITYAQNGRIVLEKTERDLTFDGNNVYFLMSQKDTREFTPGQIALVQVRALSQDDLAYASAKFSFKVEDVLNKVVL